MKFIKRFLILALCVTLPISNYYVSASIIGDPNCFITGKVTELIPEEKSFSIEIIQINESDIFCPVETGEVHTLRDRSFKIGSSSFVLDELQVDDRIRAGVVRGSSMGVDGNPIPWLHWSDVTLVTNDSATEESINNETSIALANEGTPGETTTSTIVSDDIENIIPVAPTTNTQDQQYMILALSIIALSITGYVIYRSRR